MMLKSRRAHMKNGQAGFTLVELMILISIVGITATVGTISLLNELPVMRLKSVSRDIFSTMIQAKVEAIRRGGSVAVSFNTLGNSYTMFFDNGDGGGVADNGLIDGTENVLQIGTLPEKVTFVDPTTFNNNALVFTSRGIPSLNGALGGGTVKLRTVDSVRQRSIIVSSAGRIRIDAN